MTGDFIITKSRKGRYEVLARRDEKEEWTDWSACGSKKMGLEHCDKVRKAGYKAKMIDKKKCEVIVEDD